ncbi:hypothetical protein J6590_074958 [Homalodisca vitripennis]|nr:hypothetical protein J6590_074958 [Homalodisca vitripennis]
MSYYTLTFLYGAKRHKRCVVDDCRVEPVILSFVFVRKWRVSEILGCWLLFTILYQSKTNI